LLFTKLAPNNGGFWPAIIEKAYAKVAGNYEASGVGGQYESFRVLTGAPAKQYMMNSITDVNILWSLIDEAVTKNWLIGAGTDTAPPFGLVGYHGHTILGRYILKDVNGIQVARLVRVRNPWSTDDYTGPWNDNDTKWTAALKA
jgi:hypothetical protein